MHPVSSASPLSVPGLPRLNDSFPTSSSYFFLLPRSLSSSPPSGPELEVTGYGCEDHFLEPDTATHAAEVK